jgi:hypothetical protein
MNLNSRKFYIWIISVSFVALLYLLYVGITRTTHIDTREQSNVSEISEPNDTIGSIGDVGVGTVSRAEFTVMKNQTIERKWGFKKLLHQKGNEWQLKKPFMTLYRKDFECNITADMGTVEVQTALGKPEPKDATLKENVVLHITPIQGSDVPETKIYLDDITFISDRSLLSTPNPVEIVSEQAHLTGAGLELIYNEQTQKLEYMKIRRLDKLTIEIPQSEQQSSGNKKAKTTQKTQPVRQKTQTSQSTTAGNNNTESKEKTSKNQNTNTYKCFFRENVEIKSKNQNAFAELLTITNIDSVSSESQQRNNSEKPGLAADKDSSKPTPAPREAPEKPAVQKVPAPGKKPKSEQVVITCDNGIVLIPSKSRRSPAAEFERQKIEKWKGYSRFEKTLPDKTTLNAYFIEYNAQSKDIISDCRTDIFLYPQKLMLGEPQKKEPVKLTSDKTHYFAKTEKVVFDGNCVCTMPRPDIGKDKQYSLTTPKLIVELPGKHRTDFAGYAHNHSELNFYASPFISDSNEKVQLPVTVTAEKKISFLSALNLISFEGDALCRMVRPNPNGENEYTLSGPRLIVKLNEKDGKTEENQLASIKHVTVDGGTVRLSNVRKIDGDFYNGVELKCRQFDYESKGKVMTALGEGSIAMDNSNLPEPEHSKRFDLQKPCYSVIRGFETLLYELDKNEITVKSPDSSTLIDYFPIENGEYGEQVSVSAGFIKAFLMKTPEGGNELSKVRAKKGVTYEDNTLQFAGSDMLYQAEKSEIIATGAENRPCLLNGSLVDGVRYNTKTGKFKAEKMRGGLLK